MLVLNARMRVVDQLAFAPAGPRLYAAGSNVPDLRYKPDNRGIDVWDLPGGPDPTGRLFPDELIAGFAVNPASGWLYVGTGMDYHSAGEPHDESGYFAVPPAGGEPVRLGMTGGNAFVLAVHPSGEWLVGAGHTRPWRAAGGWGSQRLVRWRQPAGAAPAVEWELPGRSNRHTYHVAADPGAARLVTHELEFGRAVTDLVYELRVRDPATGTIRSKTPVPGKTVAQILFSPDGAWLVVRAGPSLLVWDARDLGRGPRKVRGGRTHFTAVAFHPSGGYLAAAGSEEVVRLYDTESWAVARTFAWNVGKLRSVAFSPDGTLAAAGSDSGKIVVWDVDV